MPQLLFYKHPSLGGMLWGFRYLCVLGKSDKARESVNGRGGLGWWGSLTAGEAGDGSRVGPCPEGAWGLFVNASKQLCRHVWVTFLKHSDAPLSGFSRTQAEEGLLGRSHPIIPPHYDQPCLHLPTNPHPPTSPLRTPVSRRLSPWLPARFQHFSAIIFPRIPPQAPSYLFTYARPELLTTAQ